jgi:hypothetical protein
MAADKQNPGSTDEIPTLPKKTDVSAHESPELGNMDGPTLRREDGKVIVKKTLLTDAGAAASPGATAAGAAPVGRTLPSIDEKTKVYKKPGQTVAADDKTVVNPRPVAAPKAQEGGTSWLLIGAVLVAAGVAVTFIVLSLRERGDAATAEGPSKRGSAAASVTATAGTTAAPAVTSAADPTKPVETAKPSDPPAPPKPGGMPASSSTPTAAPTTLPTGIPSGLPSWIPTALPTTIPTALPTAFPSGFPFPTAPKPTATAKPASSGP